MIVSCGMIKPLSERLQIEEKENNAIYHYFEEERLKVYLPFANQYVTNVLTKSKVSEWRTGGYFIQAQTGSGKSTLIKDVIAKVASSRGARLLLVVPRVALSMQYKLEFAKEYCSQALEELQDKGIKKRNKWGPVDIFAMQELVNCKTRAEILEYCSDYDFLIIDEVHAFTGDASFNPFTEEILEFLVCQVGKQCKRVYLTATPEIIIEEIVALEAKVSSGSGQEVKEYGFFKEEVWLTFFRFKLDYSYLRPHFFEKEATLLNRLINLSLDEKVLIFVQAKSQGMRLQNELGSEKAIYMDAENKLTTEEESFSMILKENSYDKQFLIVTRFMDVGVNLKDYNIKHVVIFHKYKEDIIQMLGRKRIMSNDVVNLYIKVPKYTEIVAENERLEEADKEMRRIQSIYQHPGSGWYSDLPIPLFLYMHEGIPEIRSNLFSFYINEYHRMQLCKYINGYGDGWDYYRNFIHVVLSWFPGHREIVDLEKEGRTLTPIKAELEGLLEPYADKELNKDEMLELNNQILELMKITRRSDERSSISMSKIKSGFQKYGVTYIICNQSKNGKTGIWKVERGIWQ